MFWWQNWVWFRNGEPTWFFCGSPKSITAICGWVKFLHLKLQFLGLEKISPDHLGMVCFSWNEWSYDNEPWSYEAPKIFGLASSLKPTKSGGPYHGLSNKLIFVQLTWHFDQQIKRGMGQNHEENLWYHHIIRDSPGHVCQEIYESWDHGKPETQIWMVHSPGELVVKPGKFEEFNPLLIKDGWLENHHFYPFLHWLSH